MITLFILIRDRSIKSIVIDWCQSVTSKKYTKGDKKI